MQCDIDILGEPGNLAEIELILATTAMLGKLSFQNFTVCINDRNILKAMAAYSGFREEDYDEAVSYTHLNVKFDKDYSIDEIDEEIVPVVEKITGDHNIQTQKVSGTKQVIIKTKTLSLAKREQVNKALKTTFGVKESDITAENISSTISGEMRRDAVIAVIVATIFMLLYIWRCV